jgi:hypothetical protein
MEREYKGCRIVLKVLADWFEGGPEDEDMPEAATIRGAARSAHPRRHDNRGAIV